MCACFEIVLSTVAYKESGNVAGGAQIWGSYVAYGGTICGALVWKLLHIILLMPRIWKGLADFFKKINGLVD